MTEIRPKDRLFLALAIPLAAAALYWYAWRADAGRRLEATERQRASLVAEEDFEGEFAMARRERESAEAELESERKVPPPAAKVKANPEDSEADREVAALKVFRDAGLRVVASEQLEGTGPAADLLQASGFRPRPMSRRYVLEGSYSQVVKALSAFAEGEMAVAPERVGMSEAGHWTMEVAL